IVGTFHVGQPLRALNMLLRVGHSPMSNEIVLSAAFAALGGLGVTISPPVEGCGEKCVKLNVQYELDVTHRNALYCHEGQEGVKG
ncbi:dimethyl sulfoxide reductase anchor subunit, partial [Salmonella enterica subsp. enterica serovar Anatum]|nr:dimethyl sulfoxide reductase anchor subunit [Salmonella enterica subsp. enterica serovar Anatum]